MKPTFKLISAIVPVGAVAFASAEAISYSIGLTSTQFNTLDVQTGHNDKATDKIDIYNDFSRLLKLTRTKTLLMKRLQDVGHEMNKRGGVGMLPLEKLSEENVKDVISRYNGRGLSEWVLFPNTNGTLIFQLKDKRKAAVSIGNEYFSYSGRTSSGDRIKGRQRVNADAIVAVMKNLETNC